MIGRDEIAEAARYADAQAEELGLAGWALDKDLSLDGMVYVASQRALRAAMTLDGQDPRTLSKTEASLVRLPPELHDMVPLLAAVYMDGFAAGFTAKERTA